MAKRYHGGEGFGGMLSEDSGAPAHMPQNVIQKTYPSNPADGMPENYDDTIHGIDKQISHDSGLAKKNARSPKDW